VRSEPFPDLRVEAALFVLNLDSEATFSGDQAVTTPGRPSHHHGIELSASYKPLPWLRLDGDFAASRARFANIDPGTNDTEPGHPGNYIPNAPNVVATANATAEDLSPWFGGYCQLSGPRAPFSGPAQLERGSVIGEQRSSPTRAAAPPTRRAYHGRLS